MLRGGSFAYQLARNLSHVSPEYHQEIAEKAIAEGNPWAVLQNTAQFKQVNVLALIETIAALDSYARGSRERGIAGLVRELSGNNVKESWARQIPQKIIEKMVELSPSTMAYRADKFGETLDRKKLVEKLFLAKKFEALIMSSSNLNIERNESFVARIIDAGGAEDVITHILIFPRLSRKVYVSLVGKSPKRAFEKVLKFEGVTKEDIRKAIQNLPKDKQRWVIDEYVLEIAKEQEEETSAILSLAYVILGEENSDAGTLERVDALVTDLRVYNKEQEVKRQAAVNNRDLNDPKSLVVHREYGEAYERYHKN